MGNWNQDIEIYRKRVMVWTPATIWTTSATIAKGVGIYEHLVWSLLYGLWKEGKVERRVVERESEWHLAIKPWFG